MSDNKWSSGQLMRTENMTEWMLKNKPDTVRKALNSVGRSDLVLQLQNEGKLS